MFTATITKDEIRHAWNEIQAGRNPVSKQLALSTCIDEWRSTREDRWIGCSGPQMNDWLKHGYSPEGEPLNWDASGQQDVLFPALQTDEEEGELMIDAVLSGEDEFRLRWEDKPAPRSVKIVAQINMLASTPASVLAEYCDFILRAVDAAKAQGAAPSLEIKHIVDDSIVGERRCEFTIPLVEEGDEIDPTAWRAFVSKASFRTLGFLARGIAADKAGKRVANGLGRSAGPGWKVSRKDDIVFINCPPSAQTFPEELMENQLKEIFND